MNVIHGNLLDLFDQGVFNVIAHGCNCHHDMSGGIAAQIAKRYPAALEIDQLTPKGEKAKLGHSSLVYLNTYDNDEIICEDEYDAKRRVGQGEDTRAIVNAYTQFYPGADARLKAIRIALSAIAATARESTWPSVRIGIPMIGCGIGGLTREHLEPIVDQTCSDIDLVVVEFKP